MIIVKNLFKKYGKQPVLEGFSHEFAEHGITCLLGSSGSGKSTLFNLIAGFDREYKGEILVDGQNIANLTENELSDYRKNTIGFVFQEYHLLTGYTVLENILLAAELVCQDQAKNRARAMTLLHRLGIEDKADEKIETLSGGQKQRVAIARALMGNPKLILADEPTGALDRKTADEIMEILSEISQKCPVLIITHDRKICDYADEIIAIDEGKCKVERATINEFIKNVSLKENQQTASVSMFQRAFQNFRVHFKRNFGIALSVAVAVCAVLLSFSSQNIIDENILSFEEKNTAFAWGQIGLEKESEKEDLQSVLSQSPYIQHYYDQYKIPESELTFDKRKVFIPSKEFGSIAAESMNMGVMPRVGEIAITPSLARKFAENIQTLMGKEVLFTCRTFTKKLKISGIYNGSFDDYYLDADTEQEMYRTLNINTSPVSVAYQVSGFDEVLEIEEQFVQKGFSPVSASKQVESLNETFARLQILFVLVSGFVVIIALTICILLLVKNTQMRSREIGLLMALGYRRGKIHRMLFSESMLLSILSVFITVLVCFLFRVLSKIIPVHISSVQLAVSVFATVILVWLTTAVCNEKLLKTDPAEVLRK